MKKICSISVFLLIITGPAFPADVNLAWDPSAGATGYKIQKSIDLGITWSSPVDVGNVTVYEFIGVEENVLVLFRVSSYNLIGEGIRTEAGAWYDHRKKPPTIPSGLGIK